jgi:hypothetical protein
MMARVVEGRGQSDPWLLVDENDRVYYGFVGACQFGIATSEDGGASWSAPVTVHDLGGCADKGSLASDRSGTVYASYVELTDTLGQIALARSLDGGQSWTPSVVIPATLENVHFAPVMAALPNGTVHVAWWAWDDGNILVATSRDFGDTWASAVKVNPEAGSVPLAEPPEGSGPFFPPFPSIAVDAAGLLYIAWQDYATGNWDILLSRSEDGGATWSPPVRVNDDASENQWMVALGVDVDNVLHAAWYDGRTGNTNVMYATSSDKGNTWSRNARMTTVPTPFTLNRLGDYFSIALDPSGEAQLVWTDIRGVDLDIYYTSTGRF